MPFATLGRRNAFTQHPPSSAHRDLQAWATVIPRPSCESYLRKQSAVPRSLAVMQGLSSSALGAPVETEAASVATEQRNGAPEARRSEGPGERSDATQPGMIKACGLHDIRTCWPSGALFPKNGFGVFGTIPLQVTRASWTCVKKTCTRLGLRRRSSSCNRR